MTAHICLSAFPLQASDVDLASLVQLLALADEISLDTTSVRAGQQRRAALQEALQVQEALMQAVQAADAATTRTLVSRARNLTVQTPDLKETVEAAERALVDLERADAERAAAAATAAVAAAHGERTVQAVQAPGLQPLHVSTRPTLPTPPLATERAGEWVAVAEGSRALPCLPLADRVQMLQGGSSLIKVAPAADRWKERDLPRVAKAGRGDGRLDHGIPAARSAQGGFGRLPGLAAAHLCLAMHPHLPCSRAVVPKFIATRANAFTAQVADSKLTRHRFSMKLVQLTSDQRRIVWDDGKKSVELAQVMRISIGHETLTLKRLYASPGGRLSSGGSSAVPDAVSSYHWFSLHTASRSFDFGASKECGSDENETVVLWVLTLQQLIAPRLEPGAVGGSCLALSNAQYQWQRYDAPSKEWPCLICTFNNPPGSPQCHACAAHRPAVTICPCLTPMLQPLVAIGKTLGVPAFADEHAAHLLWFLVQAIEAPLPPPFAWAIRAPAADPTTPHLVMTTTSTPALEDAGHPYLVELRRRAMALLSQLHANGGVPDFSGAFQPPRFVAPLDSPHSSSADGSSYCDTVRDSDLGSWRQPVGERPEGLSQREFEEALAAAALHESQQHQQHQQRQQQQSAPLEEERPGLLDAADVFRHCMAGSVVEVERFLVQGGHADTVYKSAYGWDVGPDWTFTKPADGMTVLNYLATWSDIIGDAAPEIGRLLLRHGAALERDDAQDQWFTPLHNAVANGAAALAAVMLDFQPAAIHMTTGTGQQPLHVLALCQPGQELLTTLEVLLQRRRDASGKTYAADLSFAEPFYGHTALHLHAKEGNAEVCVRLLEAGAPAALNNEAGRTALQEAMADLDQLVREDEPGTIQRRSRLKQTADIMEIAVIAS